MSEPTKHSANRTRFHENRWSTDPTFYPTARLAMEGPAEALRLCRSYPRPRQERQLPTANPATSQRDFVTNEKNAAGSCLRSW